MQSQTDQSQWVVGIHAWARLASMHAELGYRPGRMNFHNFLRNARPELLRQDAIRRAKMSVFKWFETDGLISQRRDWLIGFKV